MAALVGSIQIRKDTAANWTANNPTLLSGELGLETDMRRVKIGDGVTAWNALAYSLNPLGVAAATDILRRSDGDGRYDAIGSAAAAQAASQPLDADLTSYANAADAAARRALIGGTTIGGNYFGLANPGAVTFPRQNADNTVTSRTAAELRSDIAVLGLITKPTDEGRTSSALAADSTLVLPMLPNTNYAGQITFYVSASAAGDFKSRITGPAGGTVKFLGQYFAGSAGSTLTNRTAAAYDGSDLSQTSASDFLIRAVVYFTIANGVNAGNLEVTWAQVAASGTTTMLAGSTIEWTTF